MAVVTLDNITKIYPGNEEYTVKETSLTINDEEFVVLVGPSGCGKSTMLRMVAGLEDISGGTIVIDGRVVNDVQPKDRDISMVFQNYALYPHMTVRENISFSLKLKRVPEDQINDKVQKTAEILGLQELLERKPKAMSGGQRQRVALGRAIIRDPKVLLMDEPLSNLDAKLRGQMRAEILKLHKTVRNTIIYVTHDQVEAMTMGDRIVVLDSGYVQQADTPYQVYNFPANKFVAGFMGSPPMNFLTANVFDENGQFYLQGQGVEPYKLPIIEEKITDEIKALAGKEVVLGIRPEDVYDETNLKAQNFKDCIIKSEVDIVEPLGAELYVHTKVGSENMIGRIEPDVNVGTGMRFSAFVDPSRLHIFDIKTEKRISK